MNEIEIARTKVLMHDPFYGTLLLKLCLVRWNKPYVMAVDGVNLFYNESMLSKYTREDLMVIVIHEVLHCVFLHMMRTDSIPKKWWKLFGSACDYAINAFITHETKYTLPSDGLYDRKYVGLTAEKILELLKDEDEETQQDIIEKSEGMGIMLPAPDGTEESDGNSPPPPQSGSGQSDDKKIEMSLSDQWKQNLAEAIYTQKSVGDVPGSLVQLVDDLINPKLPWNVLLENYVQTAAKSDYSFNRPNRQHISSGLYLPSAYSEKVEDVIVAVDTSCSVSTDELSEMQTEINSILENIQPENTIVIHCDTRVNRVDEYSHYDYPVKLDFTGRGGTAFKPVFDRIDELGLDPMFVIYFTDLGGSFDFPEPPYPTLWVNTYDQQNAPMGETFHLQQVKHDYR